MKNYYEILEISENASQEVVERVYKLFAKKYHPDVNPDNPKEAEEKFKEITEAYEVLSDELKRKSYDYKLKYERQKQSSQDNNSSSSSDGYTQTKASSNSSATNHKAQSSSFYDSYREQRAQQEVDRIFDEMAQARMQQMQAEREYQIKKAYNDAYVEALKSMGIKVVYKKTFKEKIRDLVNIIIVIIIMAIIGFILFLIPSVREQILNFWNMNPFVK